MTREDIRKLLGGYATGSLTEAERKLLFDAALDDQELFDELAQEQALKEVLDEPGAKQRLIAVLAPQPRAWWLKAWPWVALTAAAAVVVGIVLLRPPAPQQIAEVQIPASQVEAPPPANVPAPVQPAAAATRRKEPAPELPLELRKERPPEIQNFVEDKAEPPKAPEAVPTAEPALPVPVAPATSSTKDTVTIAEAAPLLKTESAETPGAIGAVGGGGGGGAVGRAGGAAGGGRGGGGRGGGRGGGAQFVPSPQAAPSARIAAAAKAPDASVAARFAFDYSVTPEGRLRVLPSADGFLTVSVSNGGASQVLFSDRPTQAASAIEVPLPGDSTVATIVFARTTGAGAAAGRGGAVDPPSGTKTDPAPSPNSRLQAIIQLTPRE